MIIQSTPCKWQPSLSHINDKPVYSILVTTHSAPWKWQATLNMSATHKMKSTFMFIAIRLMKEEQHFPDYNAVITKVKKWFTFTGTEFFECSMHLFIAGENAHPVIATIWKKDYFFSWKLILFDGFIIILVFVIFFSGEINQGF